jgi:hypothetical protein
VDGSPRDRLDQHREFIRDPHAERVAAVFYGLWLLLISVTLAGMWHYISADQSLLPGDFSQTRIDRIARVFQPNIALYTFAIALALIVPQIAAAPFSSSLWSASSAPRKRS